MLTVNRFRHSPRKTNGKLSGPASVSLVYPFFHRRLAASSIRANGSPEVPATETKKHNRAKLLPPDRARRGNFPEDRGSLAPLIAPIYAPLLPFGRKVVRDVFGKGEGKEKRELMPCALNQPVYSIYRAFPFYSPRPASLSPERSSPPASQERIDLWGRFDLPKGRVGTPSTLFRTEPDSLRPVGPRSLTSDT